MQTLESRLAACAAAALAGVVVAGFGIWQVPRPDTWLFLGVASALILLGTLGVLFIERAPRLSLWAVLGAILTFALAAAPAWWVVTLATNPDETPQTLFQGDLSRFAVPFGEADFASLAWNSGLSAIGASAVGLVVGAAVAYPLAHGQLRGRRIARGFVWASLFVPVVALVGPWSFRLGDAGRLDTGLALGTSYLLLTVPISAAGLLFIADRTDGRGADLARAEGATGVQRFRYVTLPSVVPGVIGVAALSFLAVWNDLLIAATVTVWHTETVGVWVRTLPGPAEQSGLLIIWLIPAAVALIAAIRAADSVFTKEESA